MMLKFIGAATVAVLLAAPAVQAAVTIAPTAKAVSVAKTSFTEVRMKWNSFPVAKKKPRAVVHAGFKYN